MRLILATLLIVSTAPLVEAANRYAGRYAGECGDPVCELDIRPIPDGWTIRWTATDPKVLDSKPKCSFTTKAELGSATVGPAGVVDGIAVGRVRGRPFGIFDLEPGRVSWSSSWEACRGMRPKTIDNQYELD